MQNQDINTLLAKHFNGEALPEEQDIVALWIASNPQEYKRLQALIMQTDQAASRIPEFDLENSWNKIDTQIRGKQNKTIKLVERAPQRRLWMSVAAALFLVTSFGLIYYSSYYNPLITVTSGNLANKRVTLEDGSIVSLNANTTLKYFKHLSSDKRQVRLEGEAFFEVTKNPARPFIVDAGKGEIKVLGTSFNVNTGSDKVEVIVKTGKVQLSSTTKRDVMVTLLPGNRGILNNNQLEKDSVLSENELSWKTGRLVFKNEQLANVVKTLETTYHRKIILDSNASSCAVTATFFTNKSLDSVLDELKLILKFNYEVKKDYILIHNLACENDNRQ
ncbi:ferric-dicitrate binding protein FerR (iron transport regulator) [Pedobacter cryoconitis]|uniref:Ferric-dicitrate binding protein FerR (Iron transport regulator) n=1 Tax=Pedobacter cryoconitis TaxID=188932 RepID=A0A7W8ZN91_9SPHI|nr:FecR domain-containing protein [Pedobacter cryoconitis]MBB5637169.1 ferric-dicitrate binding protein FerR (iron transport regulator) [Pedobacter cryoconitis]